MPKKFDKVLSLKEKEPKITIKLSEEESTALDFVKDRCEKMSSYFESLGLTEIWKEADEQYVPSKDDNVPGRKIFAQDETTGKRSKLIPVGDTNDWKTRTSEPTLLTKIQTVMSIIVDKNPKVNLKALNSKYDKTIKVGNALLDGSWDSSNFKQYLKLFVFNLTQYRWTVGRTYPKILKRKKRVMTEFNPNDPSKSTFEDRIITDYSGLYREILDPYRVRIDEMTKPNDPCSLNDWYFDKDFSYDTATLEFGDYPNWKYVKPNSKKTDDDFVSTEGNKTNQPSRTDIVTIRFYENRDKDLYVIYVPDQDIPLYSGPLPNDDGKLSIWQTYWILRNFKSPFGVSLWELIRQKKGLYDKFNNMTMDQLQLSIYKMFFYSGTTAFSGDQAIKIKPGAGYPLLGGDVKWMEVPGPGQESWDGLKFLKAGLDDDSGVPPIIEGELTGKTLGEVLNAKESALKRLGLPLDNICDALTIEADISLSWLYQIYSTPEIKTFTTDEEFNAYQEEFGQANAMDVSPDTGEITATFYKEVPLKVQKTENGFVPSKEYNYFNIPKDLSLTDLRWKGLITIDKTSIVNPSVEIEKQRKMELFNIVTPLFAQPPEMFSKPAKRIIEIFDESVEDWFPDMWLQYLQQQQMQEQPLFIQEQMGMQGQQYAGDMGQAPSGRDRETIEGQQNMQNPGLQKVTSTENIGSPKESGLMGRMSTIMGNTMQRQ